MRPIGFSTGAIAKSDHRKALSELRRSNVNVVELSALRLTELPSLVADLPNLQLDFFSYVSFHAPSRFEPEQELGVIDELDRVVERGIPIVVHPDVIFSPDDWRHFGCLLFIENMDKRKRIGRTANDLRILFEIFPDASMCLDLGHVRQVDPTMHEARLMLEQYQSRLAQVHISDVNTSSQHEPISRYAMRSFQIVARFISGSVPIILETLIDAGQSDISREIAHATESLECASVGTLPLAG